MLGKKILKRLTRLGLSAYLMMWCMSFTVCASDFPVSDMVMEDKAAVAIDATENEASDENEEILDNDSAPATEDGLSLTGDLAVPSDDIESDDEEIADVIVDDTIPAENEESDDAAAEDEEALAADDVDDVTEDVEVIDSDELQNINGTMNGTIVILRPQLKLNVSEMKTTEKKLSFYAGYSSVLLSDHEIVWELLDENFAPLDENLAEIERSEGFSCNVTIDSYGPLTFYVVVKDAYYEGSAGDKCKVEFLGPDTGYIETISLNLHDIVITDKTVPLEIEVADFTPANGRLEKSCLKKHILDSKMTDITDEISSKIMIKDDGTISLEGLTKSFVFYVKVEYENPWLDNTDWWPSDICRVQYVAPEDEAKVEIEFPQKSINVELYKPENILPVNILADYGELLAASEYSNSYYITDAYFADSDMNHYFEISVVDGDQLNIRASDYVVNGPYTVTEINKMVGSKYKSALVVTVCGSSFDKTFVTEDIVTFNIKKSAPTVKAGKLTFNPYATNVKMSDIDDGENDEFLPGYEMFEPAFTGAAVDGFYINASKSYAPTWVADYYNERIIITNDLNTTTKGGKIPVIAHIREDEWRLPNRNRVQVDIPYAIKNVPPKVTVTGATKAILNPAVDPEKEYAEFTFTINSEDEPYCDDIICFVRDSKGKDANNAFEIIKARTGDIFTISFSLKSTTPGETYTISPTPVCKNGKLGTAAKVTITVVSTKDSGKVGMTVSLKGELNAFDPNYSYVTATVTPKNIARFETVTVSLKTSDGKPISEEYVYGITGSDGVTRIRQNVAGEHIFPLIEGNLDGKKIKANITGMYLMGGKPEYVSVVKDITVKRNAVTPKLNANKATINPAYQDSQTIYFYATGSDSYTLFNYMCRVYCGKENIFNQSAELEYGTCSFTLDSENIGDLSMYKGKTLEVRITPTLPAGLDDKTFKELKTVTYKLTILDPAKSPVSVKASVKGSINSISYYSFAEISLKYKNIYNTGGYHLYAHFYPVKGDQSIDWDSKFSYYPDYYNNEKLYVYRQEYYDTIPDGTYKIDIALKSGDIEICNTTASFKVAKGKVAFVISKGTMELYNNNTKRDTFVLKTKETSMDDVHSVVIADDSSIFDLYSLGNGKYSIGLKRTENGSKYVEVDKKKNPITKAVTKTVKLNVYNEGSDKPATYSIKVKINP